MKNIIHRLALPAAVVAALTISCATPGFGPSGGLFTSATVGIYGTSTSGQKTGEACAQSYVGFVALGDATAEEAMADGGITEVTAMNIKTFSILGLYAEMCTVVRGN